MRGAKPGKENPAYKHGMTRTPEYRAWDQMKRRCIREDHPCYKDYGGRGIRVCDRWKDFCNFFADMGFRPSRDHSLDRINNNGNYEPGNVRWATLDEQKNNTRYCRFIEYRGKRMTVAQAVRLAGSVVTVTHAHQRIKIGWPVYAAVEMPKGTLKSSIIERSQNIKVDGLGVPQ